MKIRTLLKWFEIKNRLDEGIFADFARQADLIDWNSKQKEIWKQAVSDGVVERSDAIEFKAFGKFFYDFYDNFKKYPSYYDYLKWVDS